jgi:energy-coupling factor transporter transmembrane protein EcfT
MFILTAIFAAAIAVIVLAFIAAVYAVAGFAFGFMWNLLAPVVWHAAPHLGWLAAGALGILVGAVQWLFGRWESE